MLVRLAVAWTDPLGVAYGAGDLVDIDVVTLAELEELGVVNNMGDPKSEGWTGPTSPEPDGAADSWTGPTSPEPDDGTADGWTGPTSPEPGDDE
jgi:hypothetical protein